MNFRLEKSPSGRLHLKEKNLKALIWVLLVYSIYIIQPFYYLG